MKKMFLMLVFCAYLFAFAVFPAQASDHLDTPAVISDPAADIGDLYAWMSPKERRLNLVMTIVGKQFSDRLQYVFHIDSGKAFGKTSVTITIVCQFTAQNMAECWAGNADHAKGIADNSQGLTGQNKKFQIYAGLRDDPFFNNVRGTRAALNVAAAALKNGATKDSAGCTNFEAAVSDEIFDKWKHTEGGEAKNLLAGWKTGAIVVSIDLETVSKGGKLLAVWAGTHILPKNKQSGNSFPQLGEPIERMGRALTANMLIGPLDADEISDARKDEYNRAAQKNWAQFTADFERTLGLFDGYDRRCGNQWLSAENASNRYHNLAVTLADDRIWINSNSKSCEQYLAVELAVLNKQSTLKNDCGGRTPNYNADAVFRSLLVEGTADKVYDGLYRDDAAHSPSVFPFLAPPQDSEKPKSYSLADKTGNYNDATRFTTLGAIALENLDHLIDQAADKQSISELLLTRSRFLGDYEALNQVVSNAEIKAITATDFLSRAKARSAVHRFTDALEDLKMSEMLGADERKIFAVRAAVKIAQGKADEVIPELEKEVLRKPSYASYSSLANAHAAVERFDEADNLYQKSLDELKTTSPFPHAWIYFARGLMWSEYASDKKRGESFYKRAIEILPEFAVANIHLAEIEIARGEIDSAKARLKRIVESNAEPEATEIYGALEMRSGNLLNGNRLIARARQTYEKLLAQYPLAFADHAAEFYLRTGTDAERALDLAEINLKNRETRRSYDLAIRAAKAANQPEKMQQLIAQAETRFGRKFNF